MQLSRVVTPPKPGSTDLPRWRPLTMHGVSHPDNGGCDTNRKLRVGGIISMQSSHSLDRLAVKFDHERLVGDAGLSCPPLDLFDDHVDLGDAPGRANVGH